MTKKKSRSSFKKKLAIAFVFLLLLAGAGALTVYRIVFNPITAKPQSVFISIPTGSDFNRVMEIMDEKQVLKGTFGFKVLAKQIGYDSAVKPGHYEIKPGMNNKQILGMLKSGRQSPVNLVLHSSWTKEKVIEFVDEKLETDSMYLVNLLNDSVALKAYGFTPDNVIAVFVPNTYSFFWNTSGKTFFERMVKEHKKFWNEKRRAAAEKIGLSPIEVSILASIVEKETVKFDEMARIAGVYMNRVKIDMKLEADPTVKFAVGDPTIRRVKGIHLKFDSPYNTYMYKGLPPGPICTPSIQAIEAVLNYEEHKYMFFCAKEDFSGYHNFAVTGAQHKINSQKYHFELNKLGIQ